MHSVWQYIHKYSGKKMINEMTKFADSISLCRVALLTATCEEIMVLQNWVSSDMVD